MLRATGESLSLSVFQRAGRRSRILLQGQLRSLGVALSLVEGKRGLEIGGPSEVFRERRRPLRRRLLPIYDHVGGLDNCDLSRKTMWATHQDSFVFSERKAPGIHIFRDASDLSSIPDQSYDFVLSCHNLEHLANPVKALMEWKRVTRPRGGLILVLPHYRRTFDHRRAPTPIEHMLEDYASAMGEEDLSHLPEILNLHDLSLDPGAGSIRQFRERSQRNLSNRCLHHHVFDESNSRELLAKIGIEVLAVELAAPFHIFLLARFGE